MKRWFSRTAIAGSVVVTLTAATVGIALATTTTPTAKTTGAYGITDHTVTMGGIVTTGGVTVKDRFFWGPNRERLVHSTPLRTISSSTTSTHVGAGPNDTLAPGTTYYYELVVEYQGPGSDSFSKHTVGGVRNFTTKPGAVSVRPYRFTAHNNVVAIPVHCYGVKACNSRVQIQERVLRSPDGKFYRTATDGQGTLLIPKGMTDNVVVKLTENGVKRLREANNHMLRLRMRVTTTTGQPLFFNYIRVTL